MKFFSVRSFVGSRYPLAIGAGLLLAAAFPKIGIAGFAWVAPGLMLAAALGKEGAESFRIGYIAGLAHYLASLHWLLFIPVTGFPILGWMALCSYLGLFPAVWVWLVCKISNFEFQTSDPLPARNHWLGALHGLADWTWSRRMLWTLSCAALWVAQEMIVTRLFTGFPWNLLGVSQHRIVPLIQIASVTGVPGLTFLVAWTSASLLCATAVIIHRPNTRSSYIGEIILPLGAVAAVFVFGFHRLGQAPAETRELKLTLVQPSIPQTLIWNSENDQERFHELIALSEQALSNATDVLVWPEAALPKMIRYDEELLKTITNLAVQHHVWMILGSDDAEAAPHSSDPKEADYFNAAFLINPEGQLVERYCKRSLVIFGEYIPLVRWLPFVKWFTPIQGGFTPGDKPGAFEMILTPERRPPARRESDSDAEPAYLRIGPPAKVPRRFTASPLICFEDSFPHLVRASCGPGTDFLVNLTNDGWFGEGAAQWQHAANALFRAVENGLPLVRCTNTGLTCWFDATGRLRGFFADGHGSVYGAGFIIVTLPLPVAGEKPPPTFYHQHGDVFGWGCVCFAAMSVAWPRKRTAL